MSDQIIQEVMYPLLRLKIKNNFMDSIKLSIQAVPTGYEPAIYKNARLRGLKVHIWCFAAISI